VEEYLRGCLDSILGQSFRDFELILIDDGSPDSCGAICDEYAAGDARVRVIHQANQGIAETRNRGVAAAQGEYLLFIDSDDTIVPDLLQTALTAARERDADIVIWSYRAVDPQGRHLYDSVIDLPENTSFTLRDLPQLLLTPACVWNKLIRRRIFDDVRFPAGVWYEDLRVTPRLYLQAVSLVYLGRRPLTNYLIRPGSIMRSSQLAVIFQDRIAALNDLLGFFRIQGIFELYHAELEALVALHGFLYASLEVLQVEVNRSLLAKFRSFAENEFPDFRHNRYLKKLSRKERLQFTLLCHNHYAIIRFLSCLKNWQLKLKAKGAG
jgi:glycosyltransferase involved in cell wall biosynthesis